MKPPPFTYVRADSADEALQALAQYGDDAKVLAGGQSLIPMMNLRLAQPEVLVDIGRATDLAGIQRGGDLRIGATTSQSAVARSADVAAHAPLVRAALRYVSHPAIRSRGTFGGSIAHADPAAELPAVAVALDASLVLRGPRGTREVAAGDFFVTHLTTAMDEDEVLCEVRVPPPVVEGRVHDGFLELARRHGDFALVGVAVRLVVDAAERIAHARVVMCGVSDVPFRAREAEQLLVGSSVGDQTTVREAAQFAARDLQPPSDVHASGKYRRELAGVLVRRAVNAAFQGSARDPE
jgi:carbon-monoxide dehydrogenase medium subunit